MAQLACERGDDKLAVFVGTFLETGFAVALCEDDLVNFVVSMAEQLTGAPVIDFVSTYLSSQGPHEQPPTDEEAQAAIQVLLEANAPEVQERLEKGEEMGTIIEDLMTRPLEEIDVTDSDSTPQS